VFAFRKNGFVPRFAAFRVVCNTGHHVKNKKSIKRIPLKIVKDFAA